MGEQYDADYEFTIAELLSYNLMAHSDLITSVYAAAIAEYTIERRLMAVKHLWADQKFKLAKYIPQSVLDSAGEKYSASMLSCEIVCFCFSLI